MGYNPLNYINLDYNSHRYIDISGYISTRLLTLTFLGGEITLLIPFGSVLPYSITIN